MASPIYLVTDYKNVRRKSSASEYTDSKATLDLFRVTLIHGYYAGMGMRFFFPNEGEASRFSLHTVYVPGEIIEKMENAKFTVESIKKSGFMYPANSYTNAKVLHDAWKVFFVGEREDFLETIHPWESAARQFQIGRTYTMADLLGTLPASPADRRFLIEAHAERLAEAEERRLEAQRLADLNSYYNSPATFAERNANWQARSEEIRQQYIDEYNQVGEGLGERERWIAQFMTGGFSEEQAAAAWEIHYQFMNPPVEPPPDPPVEPPPPPPPPPPPSIEDQKRTAVAQWYSVTGGGSPGWFAGARLDSGSRTWEQAWAGSLATTYAFFDRAGFTVNSARFVSNAFGSTGIRNVNVNGSYFEWFGFYVRTGPNEAGSGL